MFGGAYRRVKGATCTYIQGQICEGNTNMMVRTVEAFSFLFDMAIWIQTLVLALHKEVSQLFERLSALPKGIKRVAPGSHQRISLPE